MLTHVSASLRARFVALLVALAALTGTLTLTSTPPASASTRAAAIVNEAAHHRGQPYVWAAAGPTRFDCSGFTLYVFGRFGRRLPHSSSMQYNVVQHVSKSSMRIGDLIFFRSSTGRITHVAIYAGSGRMWHAPHTGDHVRLASIYSSHYSVGRA